MSSITRRLLIGIAAVTIACTPLVWTPLEARPLHGGAATSGGGSAVKLATFTLVNTSGSTQAANFVTPRFGHSFKSGDIPAGTAPQFLIGGVAQPYSWGLQSYWGDGSLKHASFMLRCSSSVAGSGTVSVETWNGGTAPSASGFTLTDVYNQSLRVNAPGVGEWGNLTGNWYAYVANDANLIKAYKCIDGDAGASFVIASNFTQSSGGAAHGQLICESYVTITKNGSGGIAGFRYRPRITQPYYNYDTPAKDFRVFDPAGLSWQYGAGPTVVSWNFPYNTVTFTGTNGNPIFTGTHNYRTGAQRGSGSYLTNLVAGYFTSTTEPAAVTCTLSISGTTMTLTGVTGTVEADQIVIGSGVLDGTIITSGSGTTWTVNKSQTVGPVSGTLSRIAPNMLMFAYTTGLPDTDNTQVNFYAKCGSKSPNYVVSRGGNSTFVPMPMVLHFGDLWDGDDQCNAKWFQGTGSQAAEATVRVQFDPTYLHSTKLIPPWNIQPVNFTGTLVGNTLTPTGASGTLFIGMTVEGPGLTTRQITGGGTGSAWTVGGSPQTIGPISMTATFKGVANGGTVKDIAQATSGNFWTGTPTWAPYSCGPLSPAARGGSGNSPDIGHLTLWAACDFYNQSATSQMATKAAGLFSTANGSSSFKDRATFNYVNVSNANYTGMPTKSSAQQDSVWFGQGQGFGFTVPNRATDLGNFFWSGETNTSHKPSMAYYPWLVFGEDYFHQLVLEAATDGFMQIFAPNRVCTSPAGYGLVTGPSSAGLRARGWAMRDLSFCHVLAQNHPDGSQICQYLRDRFAENMTYVNGLFSSTYQGSFLASIKRWNAVNQTNGTEIDISCGGFMRDYWVGTIAWGAMVTESSDCLTWLNNYGTYLDWQIGYAGAYTLYGAYDNTSIVDVNGKSISGIPDASYFGIQLAFVAPGAGALSWSTSGPRYFTLTGMTSGYVPADGDIIIFDASLGGGAPGGFSTETPYVTLNNDGSGHFNLALPATPTTVIVPSSSGSLTPGASTAQGPWIKLANPPGSTTPYIPNSTGPVAESYMSYLYAGAQMAKIAGANGLGYDSVIADAKGRYKANATDFTTYIYWNMQGTA